MDSRAAKNFYNSSVDNLERDTMNTIIDPTVNMELYPQKPSASAIFITEKPKEMPIRSVNLW
jgi:hypothetical protein